MGMAVWKEKCKCWTEGEGNAERLFFAGFTIFLFRYIIVTTMFPFSGMLSGICVGLAFLLLLAKIILFDSYTLKMLAAVIGMFACGLAVAVASGYLHPFLWLLVVVAAKDISFRKILQVYILMNFVIVGMAFCAASLGLIESLAYTTDLGIRNSFGCVYPTDFAAHIFYMLVAAFYLWQEKLRWYHYIGACVLAFLIYTFCLAKLDTVCILLTAVFFGGYHVLQWQGRKEQVTVCGGGGMLAPDAGKMAADGGVLFKRTKAYFRWKKIWVRVACFSMPVLGVLMYCLSVFYRDGNKVLYDINEFITNRLSLGKAGLEDFGFSLFGQDVPMVGMGGTLVLKEEYFFVDCSYLFILLRYGTLFLFLVFAIYGVICFQRREDTALLLVIVLLAISSSIDHHLLECAYNPFGYALFAGGAAYGRGGHKP